MSMVIFGHSHIPHLEDHDGLLLNPGGATDRRRKLHCSIALLTVEDGQPRDDLSALPL